MTEDANMAGNEPRTDSPPALADSYEFTPAQGQVIAELAAKMLGVGLFVLLMAVVCWGAAIALSLRGEGGYVLGLVLVGLFFAGTGTLTLRCQRAFRKVVDTTGHDIEHTMDALRALQLFYRVKFWLVVVCLAAVAVWLLMRRPIDGMATRLLGSHMPPSIV